MPYNFLFLIFISFPFKPPFASLNPFRCCYSFSYSFFFTSFLRATLNPRSTQLIKLGLHLKSKMSDQRATFPKPDSKITRHITLASIIPNSLTSPTQFRSKAMIKIAYTYRGAPNVFLKYFWHKPNRYIHYIFKEVGKLIRQCRCSIFYCIFQQGVHRAENIR